jgi:Protein of unknown function (DUF3853)
MSYFFDIVNLTQQNDTVRTYWIADKAKILTKMIKSNLNLETPIVLLTVGQLMELLNKDKKQEVPTVQNATTYVYGLTGIKRLFNVSHATAHRYKQTILRDAVRQNGRKIIVDAEKAVELFQQKNGKSLKK